MKLKLYFNPVAMLVLVAISAYAQAPASKRAAPSAAQGALFIKSDATLSSGFETPVNKAQVRVVKAIPGGLVASYSTAKVKGTVQIVGPSDVVLGKDYVKWAIDFVLENLGGAKAPGANCTTKQTTTTSTNKDGTTTTTTTQETDCKAAG